MRAQRRYNYFISVLVDQKEEWHRITDHRFNYLKEALQPYESIPLYIETVSELPDKKSLAKKLNLPQPKANQLIYDMYQALLASFKEKPLEVKEYYHSIRVGRSWDDAKGYNRQQEYIEKQAQTINMQLPFTPRAGDFIDLSFLADPENFTSGYVHKVTHTIKGSLQEIFIEVHPFKDFHEYTKQMLQKYE